MGKHSQFFLPSTTTKFTQTATQRVTLSARGVRLPTGTSVCAEPGDVERV